MGCPRQTATACSFDPGQACSSASSWVGKDELAQVYRAEQCFSTHTLVRLQHKLKATCLERQVYLRAAAGLQPAALAARSCVVALLALRTSTNSEEAW